MSTKSIASVPLASAFNSSPGKQVEYTFNSKVMVAAMVILFIVVLFVVSLHIYAKWFWHQGTGATTRWSATHALNASWQRRRRQLELGVEEDSLAVNTSTGLDPSTVNLLPTFVYEGAMLEAEPLLECSVCLSEFQVHDKGRVLPDCKHSFHIDCIDMWLHSHSTCPLCRTPILLSLAQAENTSNPGPAISQHNLSPATHQQHAEEQNTSAGESTDSQEQPPFLLNMAGLDSHPEEAGAANKAGHKVAMLHSFIPGASVMHARTPSYAEFLCKHDIGHANSMPWMGASGSTSATTMTTEILRQQERAAMARSTSLTLSRVLSEDERAWSSQPQKSSSFRISIKRLVSRELSKGRSRVFPAGRVNVESEQSTSMMHSPV